MRVLSAGLLLFVAILLGGCGGGGNGNGADPITYRVSANAGTGGDISPHSRSVTHGATTTFTVMPDNGYQIATVTGCAGNLLDDTYLTGPITEACTVVADFTAIVRRSIRPPELISTSAVGATTASLSWLPADSGEADPIRYTVHLANQPNLIPDSLTAAAEVEGQLFAHLTDLLPERRYYAKISTPHPDHGTIWSNELSFATGSVETVLNPLQDFEVISASTVMQVHEDHLYLSDVSNLAADSILISEANGGFFRRVVSVDDSTGRVDTTSASLNELFETLHLSSETRLATLPSITSTEILRLQTLSDDVGERREFYWPETGFRLIQETEPSPGSRNSEGIGGVIPLLIPQSTDADELQEQVNNKIRLTAPARVLVEPGSLMQFDVVADLVNDANMEYEITDLELNRIREPRGMPDADMNTSMVPGVDGTRERTKRLLWTPGAEHFDGQVRPYTAEFRATAHQRDCPLWKLGVFCPHSVTVEVPIYVGWSLPEDKEATIGEERNGGVSLSGNMRLNFDPTLRVDRQITARRLQSAEVIAEGLVTFDLNARIQATSEGEVEVEQKLLPKFRFVKVFLVGKVPVVMEGEFSLTAELKATANADLDINQNITLKYDLEAGFTYERDRDDSWELLREATPVYHYTLHGEAQAQAELEVRLVPDLQITFYRMATSQMKIEPYLVGAMGLDGKFQYDQERREGNSTSSGFEAVYRFTQLDLSGGLDLKLRADLSLFDYTVAAWPSRDTDKFRIVPIRDKTLILGLAEIKLERTVVTRDDYPGAVRVAATVTDRGLLFPFAEGSGRWETVPTSDFLRLLSDPEGDRNAVWMCLDDGATGTETEYTVRFLGHSGPSFVQQYEEIKLPLQSCMIDDLPPPELTVVVVASEGGGQATVTWNEKDQWTYNVFISTDPNCDIANYILCDQGQMFPDALSGLVISGLQNDQSYFIVVEAAAADGISVVTAPIPVVPEKVVFVSEVDGAWDIFSVSLDGSDLVNLTETTSNDRLPAVSPSLTNIAFVSDRDGQNDIYVMNIDGSDVKRLTNHDLDDAFPVWSPDGKRIAFISQRGSGGRTYDIYVMDSNGGNVIRLTDSLKHDAQPHWSPDGEYIVFVSEREGASDIFLMKSDGSDQTNLTKTLATDTIPFFSPDGLQIAFVSDRDGDFDLWIMDVNGQNLVKLTSDGTDGVGWYSWSPDGSLIAFDSMASGVYNIYVVDPVTGIIRQVTDSTASDRFASWTWFGSKIAYLSDEDGTYMINVVDPDGQGVVRLFEGVVGEVFLPAASPVYDEGGGCFIATAAYGSYLEPRVGKLRDFRDDYLLATSLGKVFVSHYYMWSPPIADVIRQHESLRVITRAILTPIVFGVQYPMQSSLILFVVGFVLVKRSRRESSRIGKQEHLKAR